MEYITASDLAPFMAGNIKQMERLTRQIQQAQGSATNVRFVVFWDQWSGVNHQGKLSHELRRGADGIPVYKDGGTAAFYPTDNGAQAAWSTWGEAVLQPDSAPNGSGLVSTAFNVSPTEVDSGKPQTLENFITWATQNAPASHYALLMGSHGNGYGAFNTDTYDRLHDGDLNIHKMVTALTAEQKRGVNLNMVGFDECLMAQPEVEYSLRHLAQVVVASEEFVPGAGFPYDKAFASLVANPNEDASTLARGIVSAYGATYPPGPGKMDTLSAVDTSQLDALIGSIKAFDRAVLASKDRASDLVVLRKARNASLKFGGMSESDQHGSPWRDLGQFMSGVVNGQGGTQATPAVKQAAGAVVTALEDSVIANYGPGSGLQIYLPASDVAPDSSYPVGAKIFDGATDWYRVIRAINPQTSVNMSPEAGIALEGGDR